MDLDTNVIGVWKWSGTTVAGSKVTFEGYEEHKDEDMMALEILEQRVKTLRERVMQGGFVEQEREMMRSWCGVASQGLMNVMVVSSSYSLFLSLADSDSRCALLGV